VQDIDRQTDRFFIQDLYKVHRLYIYNRTYILSRDFIQKINKQKKYVRYTQKPQKAKLVVFKIRLLQMQLVIYYIHYKYTGDEYIMTYHSSVLIV